MLKLHPCPDPTGGRRPCCVRPADTASAFAAVAAARGARVASYKPRGRAAASPSRQFGGGRADTAQAQEGVFRIGMLIGTGIGLLGSAESA